MKWYRLEYRRRGSDRRWLGSVAGLVSWPQLLVEVRWRHRDGCHHDFEYRVLEVRR